MVTSYLNKETYIVEAEFKGDLYAKEINDFILSFKDNTTYPRRLKCIIDATNANFKFSFRDVKTYNKLKEESFADYNLVICAIIINNSTTAALSTMYAAISNSKKYNFKVFSTREAALLWLDSF